MDLILPYFREHFGEEVPPEIAGTLRFQGIPQIYATKVLNSG